MSIKKDYIILFILILFAIVLVFAKCFNISQQKIDKKIVQIKENGVVTERIDLLENTKFIRKYGKDSYNTIVIDGGAVYVEDANCRDKLCINYGKIDAIGDVIVCLPNKFVVEIVGE